MTTPQRIRDYGRDLVKKDGKVDEERMRQLLRDVADLFDGRPGAPEGGGQQVINVTRVIQQGGSTAPAAPSSPQPAGALVSAYTILPNNVGASVGNFIYRMGGATGLASNASLNLQATHYVFRTEPGTMFCTPLYMSKSDTDGIVLMRDGRGTNVNALLYLDTEGRATDNLEDIEDADGNLNTGVAFRQQLGVRLNDQLVLGRCVADVHIKQPIG